MYLYRVNILFHNEEDLQKELNLEKHIDDFLKKNKGELVSSNSEELKSDNFGKCQECGAWVSDYSKNNYISCFSNGAKLNGIWLCDLCLPDDHTNSF